MNLNERLDLAHEILDYYNVDNKIILNCNLDRDVLAFFNFDTGDIELCDDTRIPDDKTFILSILHETKHAIDAKKTGLYSFGMKYEKIARRLKSKNFDEYYDHLDEIKAERFAQVESIHWI